jgi:TolC family type I secretion outer membrane protein
MSVRVKMRRWWSFLAAVFLLQTGGPALGAETPAGRELTLPGAIQTALKHNPRVTAVREGLTAAEAQVTTARAGLYPRLDLSETYNRTTNPMWAFGTKLNQGDIARSDFAPDDLNDPDPIDNFATALNLSWRVFDGGNTWHGWQASKRQAAAAAQGVTRMEQQVAAQTAQAYVGMLLAEENLQVIEQSLETARAHSKLVVSRYEGGFVVKSDLLRAQVRIAELDQTRLQAVNGVEVAAAHLNAAMGIPIDTPLRLATPFTKCAPPAKDFDAWRRRALAERPDMVAMDHRHTAAEKGVKRALSGHLPQLHLRSAYEINSERFDDTHDNWTIGATVNLNLFAGQQISSQVAAAKAALRQLTAQREALAQQIQVETRSAFLNAQSAWQQIQVARSALAQAEEGVRIVGNRYKSGLLTIVSLLDAEVADQEARMRHFKAMHDYKVARIQLALAAGVIDAEFQ